MTKEQCKKIACVHILPKFSTYFSTIKPTIDAALLNSEERDKNTH
jgi:hypothetical protein